MIIFFVTSDLFLLTTGLNHWFFGLVFSHGHAHYIAEIIEWYIDNDRVCRSWAKDRIGKNQWWIWSAIDVALGVSLAHLAIAESKLATPVSLGFSRPRLSLFFITATNSLLLRAPSPSSSNMVKMTSTTWSDRSTLAQTLATCCNVLGSIEAPAKL